MPNEKLYIIKDGRRKSKPMSEERIYKLFKAGKVTADATLTQVGTVFGVPILDFFDEEEIDSVQLVDDQTEHSSEPQSPLFVVTAIGRQSRSATPQEILDIHTRGSIQKDATVSDAAGQHSWPIASFLNHYFPGTAQEHAPKGEPARSAELKSGGDLMTRESKTFLLWCVVTWLVLAPLFGVILYNHQLETVYAPVRDSYAFLTPMMSNGYLHKQSRTSVQFEAAIHGVVTASILVGLVAGGGYAMWFTRPTSSRSKTESPE